MTGFQKTATIETELRKAGIATNATSRRWQLANAILTTREYFGQDQVGRLRARIAQGYVGTAADEAIEEALLSGAWVEIDREMRVVESGPKDPNEKREDSHLRHVTESNPYGWAKPDAQRGYCDHDMPGQWNAYRQANNLTESERTQAGARDHRVRGCTRWEVLGNDKQPTVEFDGAVVAAALIKELAVATERQVYGETTS